MLNLDRAKEIFKLALEQYKKSCRNREGVIRSSVNDKSFFTGYCSRAVNRTLGSIFNFEINMTTDSGILGYERAKKFIEEMDECQNTEELLLLTKKFNAGKNLPQILMTHAIKVYFNEDNEKINNLIEEKKAGFLKFYTIVGAYTILSNTEAELIIYQELIHKIEPRVKNKKNITDKNAESVYNQL